MTGLVDIAKGKTSGAGEAGEARTMTTSGLAAGMSTGGAALYASVSALAIALAPLLSCKHR